MKIEIDIPDKYKERNFWVFAGIEPVARKRFDSDIWEVKVVECSRCGACCLQYNPLTGKKSGPCEYLSKSGSEYVCGLTYARPFNCCTGEGHKMGLDCTVEWK